MDDGAEDAISEHNILLYGHTITNRNNGASELPEENTSDESHEHETTFFPLGCIYNTTFLKKCQYIFLPVQRIMRLLLTHKEQAHVPRWQGLRCVLRW